MGSPCMGAGGGAERQKVMGCRGVRLSEYVVSRLLLIIA